MTIDQGRLLISVCLSVSLCLGASAGDNDGAARTCLDCGLTGASSSTLRTIPADCEVNESGKTIACSVDESLCDWVRCNNSDICASVLVRSDDDWNFTSLCFSESGTVQDYCKPTSFDTSFPPDVITCACDKTCLQDGGRMNYVHPAISNLEITTSFINPSLLPSPTTSGKIGYSVISWKMLLLKIGVVMLLLITICVLMFVSVVHICRQRKKKLRQYSHRILRNEKG